MERNPSKVRNVHLFREGHLINIVALIKRRNYKSIIYGDVCEGSYILVKKFQLARARRLAQEGQVALVTPTET